MQVAQMMHADSQGIEINYLRQQIQLFNELLRPTKQHLALRESKIIFCFLGYLSICMVLIFLMAYYLHMAWSLTFALLFIIGAIGFIYW